MSQCALVDGVGHPVKTEAGVNEGSLDFSADKGNVIHLLTLQSLSHLHDLLYSNSHYTLYDETFLEWNVMK